MHHRTGFATLFAVVSVCSVARAEQFVLVDVSYTHSTDTTRDSHFYPDLPADLPKNWTSPIDWSKGSVHIVLDVKTKPAGDAPTKLQICFEATPSYACTAQSPTYRKAGRVEWDSPFSGFWYESTVDWSKGIKESPLILKDDMNNKPHGNPMYMPTDLHVQVTLVAPGSTFVPPPAAGSGGAGMGGAGAAGAGGAGPSGAAGGGAGASAGAGGRGDAGATGTAGASGAAGAAVGGRAGAAAVGGGTAGRASAGAGAVAGRTGASAGAAAAGASGAPVVAAGAAAPSGAAGALGMMMGSQSEASGEDDSGCRTGGQGVSSPWVLGLAVLWLMRARGRKRRARR